MRTYAVQFLLNYLFTPEDFVHIICWSMEDREPVIENILEHDFPAYQPLVSYVQSPPDYIQSSTVKTSKISKKIDGKKEKKPTQGIDPKMTKKELKQFIHNKLRTNSFFRYY